MRENLLKEKRMISFRVSDDLYKRIMTESVNRLISRKSLMKSAIEEYLNKGIRNDR